MRRLALLSLVALSACSAPGGPYPSLHPRAGEAIDPRVPVVRPINDRPVLRWLVGVASVLRAADQPVSSAHVIEAVRLAETLATLRGRPLAGHGDLDFAAPSKLAGDLSLSSGRSRLAVRATTRRSLTARSAWELVRIAN